MPRIDIRADWGLDLRGGWDTPYGTRANLWDVLKEMCDTEGLTVPQALSGKFELARLIRQRWYFIASETLVPWMGVCDMSEFVKCPSHVTFLDACKRFKDRHFVE